MLVANIIEEAKLGGPQIRMVRVAAALGDAERTLIVMPRANSEAFIAACDAAGVRHVALPMTRITKEWRVALGFVLFSPIEVIRLARLLRRERIELVHASGGSWQYKAVLAARWAGIPSVWHLNDTQMPEVIRWVFRRLSPLPTGFIFASNRSRDYYGNLLAHRVQDVIPSTVDAAHFDPALPLAGDADVLTHLGAAPVIGTVANINRIKGLETLIRAAAAVKLRIPDLRVVVIGPVYPNQQTLHAELGELARSLGLSDSIEWVGGRADVRPLLGRFDVYVCSSLAESSPVSVWEAMSMARPVVSTDVGDVSLHLTDGESGFIVPVGDDAAMADRIGALLADEALRKRFGARARETVIREFSPAKIADKTLALYQRVLDAWRQGKAKP